MATAVRRARTVTAAESLVTQLRSLGVEFVFGTGAHTTIAVLDALSRSPIRFVVARHELAAAHAADGYARISGRPGVLLANAGPGVLAAMTGLATATADGTPLVVISGDLPAQLSDRLAPYRPFVKRAWHARLATDLPRLVERAFWTAASGRPGPVLLNAPMDLLARRVAPALARRHRPVHEAAAPDLPGPTAERIAADLVRAQRPLVYLDGGLRGPAAGGALLSLAEHLDLAIAYTPLGKGVVPDDHPLVCGLEPPPDFEPDLVLPLTAGPAVDPASVVRAIHRAVLEIMPVPVSRPGLWDRIRAAREAASARVDEYPLNELRAALPPAAVLVVDGGRLAPAIAQCYPLPAPGRFVMPGDAATAGFAPAVAVGVQLAEPNRVVVALAGGDGMSAQLPAVPMAVEQGAPVIFVVLAEGPRDGVDFAAVARACGADGYTVSGPHDFGSALRRAVRARRPALVEVR